MSAIVSALLGRQVVSDGAGHVDPKGLNAALGIENAATHTRTFSNLTNTRKRITFPSGAVITTLFGMALPHDASIGDDAALLMVLNAESEAAADYYLNGGVLADKLTEDWPVILLPVGEAFSRLHYGNEGSTVATPILTVDIMAHHGAGSVASANPLSGLIGGQ